MSKLEKMPKNVNVAQLKKDLNSAAKVFQSLTDGLGLIEACLIDSETSNSKISKLHEQISQLGESLHKSENENQSDSVAYATSTLKLNQEFNNRLKILGQEYESKVQAIQEQESAQTRNLKKELNSAKLEIARLETLEKSSQRKVKEKWEELEKYWLTENEKLQKKIGDQERRITELNKENQALERNAKDDKRMLEGRQTEINRHKEKLATLESFLQFPNQEYQELIGTFQEECQQFCDRCVEAVNWLPGLNRFPVKLQRAGLPRYFSKDSPAGRSLVACAIQDSLCGAMVANIFNSESIFTGPGIGSVMKVLHSKSRSQEAIWRLMMANTILGDKSLLDTSKSRSTEIANNLLGSWDLFDDDGVRDEFLGDLIDLLFNCSQMWLDLMRVQGKIYVSFNSAEKTCDSDSPEISPDVPGGFNTSETVSPLLRLFPPFFEDSPEKFEQPMLRRRGTVMWENSPILRKALEEEPLMQSPKLSNRAKRNSWSRPE